MTEAQRNLFEEPAPGSDPDDPIPEGWPAHLRALGLGPKEMQRRQAVHLEARRADQARRGKRSRELAARIVAGLAGPTGPDPDPLALGATPAIPGAIGATTGQGQAGHGC